MNLNQESLNILPQDPYMGNIFLLIFFIFIGQMMYPTYNPYNPYGGYQPYMNCK